MCRRQAAGHQSKPTHTQSEKKGCQLALKHGASPGQVTKQNDEMNGKGRNMKTIKRNPLKAAKPDTPAQTSSPCQQTLQMKL